MATREIPTLEPVTAKVRRPDPKLAAMLRQREPWTPEQYAYAERSGA